MSIYQAADSLYRLFDKVCVIYEGKMVYYGSANLARQYFFDMGYEPANRQTTADFLVAVTDSNGRNVRVGHEKIVPRTAEEFAAYFRSSKIAKINRDDMESYRREFVESRERASRFTSASQEEHVSTSRKGSPYILSVPLQARAVMARRARIIRGDIKAQVVNTMSVSPILHVLFYLINFAEYLLPEQSSSVASLFSLQLIQPTCSPEAAYSSCKKCSLC